MTILKEDISKTFDLEKFNKYRPIQLDLLEKQTMEIGFDMGSDHQVGLLLRLLVSTKPAGNFLEIGTGTGIGASWILSGMDQESHLTSLDIDKSAMEVAKNTLKNNEKVTFLLEEYETFLDQQPPNSFDLIFADAYPGKYILVEETLGLLKPGGIFIVDDMLPQDDWPEDHYELAAKMLNDLSNLKKVRSVGINHGTGVAIFTKI